MKNVCIYSISIIDLVTQKNSQIEFECSHYLMWESQFPGAVDSADLCTSKNAKTRQKAGGGGELLHQGRCLISQ